MFSSIAHAMGSSGAAGGAGGESALLNFAPLIIMLGIFYFLLIRPQQKRAREHKAMLSALKKGDTVITNAGFIGRIVEIDDDVLTIDLGETRVQLGRAYVGGKTEARVKQQGGKKEKSEKAEKAEDKAEAKTDGKAEDTAEKSAE